MKRFGSILLWSVIAAAFIGPGTVTTAASAGAQHGLSLLWALGYSIVACLVLQEASARLTVVSGRNLGEALSEQYPTGVGRVLVLGIVLGAVVLGCAAYEAGNILGGVAGAVLATGWPAWVWTLICGAVAGFLLWSRSPRTVARLLSVMVAGMGAAFLMTAWRLEPSGSELLRGAVVPSLPKGSGLLALGLVGTTVVPYNLFLGSGLARGQRLSDIRLGLMVAVGLGGLISAGVMVAGTAVEGEFGLDALADVLASRLGPWAATVVALGLFGAGLSSAITAPLAAGVTARGLFGGRDRTGEWDDRAWRYRTVWIAVLLTGVGFGLSGVRPVPAIVLAQAFNGVMLPAVGIFLFVAVNDRRLMGDQGMNGALSNAIMAGVVAVSTLLGVGGLVRAISAATGRPVPSEGALVRFAIVLCLLGAPFLVQTLRNRRQQDQD